MNDSYDYIFKYKHTVKFLSQNQRPVLFSCFPFQSCQSFQKNVCT